MAIFLKVGLRLNNYDNLHPFVEKVTILVLVLPITGESHKSKENYAHVMFIPRNATKELCNITNILHKLLEISVRSLSLFNYT